MIENLWFGFPYSDQSLHDKFRQFQDFRRISICRVSNAHFTLTGNLG
ncbi:hypothetical protein [Microseira wollei]|nr:hypothetical protein [Microseira wollei]